MAGITVEIKMEGLQHKFETLAEKSQDLKPALAKFGAHLKNKAKQKIAEQDFPPLADSTLQKRRQTGLRTLRGKLERDLRKAQGRASKVSLSGKFTKIKGVVTDTLKVEYRETRGVQTRKAVLAEFQRQTKQRQGLTARMDLKPLSVKQLAGLGSRVDRAVARQVAKPILGGLDRGLKAKIAGSSVTVTDETRGKWSEVHNKGGTAGHDAKEPKREFLKLEDSDKKVFADILKEHHLAAFDQDA